ncbi:MAG: ABC transporter substrate-binding protein [bacterium]|nr:ABC transporter substrate-binding protein [bacterium]
MKATHAYRVLGIGLLVAMLLTGASAQAPSLTLTFVRLSTAAHNAYLDPLIAAFEKAHPTFKIESINVAAGGYEAIAQRALLGAAGGTAPDLVQVGYHLTRTFVESGRAVGLDIFMKADKAFRDDNLLPAMLSLGRVDGKYYLVPIGTSTPVMYINEEAFQKAGLDPKSTPKTWAETRAAAERLKAAGYEGVLWGWSITGNWIFQTMLEQAGGRMASDDGYTATFNREPGVRVAEYFADLSSNKLMPVTDQTVQLFSSGRLGMLVDSSFQRVNLPKASNFPVRMATIPTPDGRPGRLPAGGNGIMILSQDVSRLQAAWRFARYLTEPEVNRIIGENSGYTPANQSVLVALRKQYAKDANYQVVLADGERVVPWHSWPGQNGTQISQIIRDAQHAILLGRRAPKAALDEAAVQVQALLRR